jgi:deazaflavin-dependent oxidoreductase (nitroreductase family)
MPARYLRPNPFVQKVGNPVAMRLRLASTLLVRTRRSGRVQAIPVNVLTHEQGRYLVSVRGESQWVRNLRAAAECELRQGGRTERYVAEEVPAEQRAGIIAAYRKRWGYQAVPFFLALPNAEDHPTFRLRPS